jgi:gluconolactonase
MECSPGSLIGVAASELSGQSALTTPDIPGIVAGGTPVVLVKAGLNSAEGPIAAPDGSLYFTEPSDNKIYRVDAATTSP